MCLEFVPCFAKTFSDLSVINLRVKRNCKLHVGLVEENKSYLSVLLIVLAKTVLTIKLNLLGQVNLN